MFIFHTIGFYNEANTIEFCSILVNFRQKQDIYTQSDRHDAVQIKRINN